MRSSNESILGITGLTLGILAVFFVFGWFNVRSVLGLTLLVGLVLLFGDHLWSAALLIPLSIPLGLATTLLIGRSYEYEITAVEIVLLLLSTGAMYALLWQRVQEGDRSRTEIWFAWCIVLAIASLLWVEDFAKYLVAVRVIIYQFLAFFCARLFLNHRSARDWVMRILPLVVAVVSLQLLFELANLGTIRRILIERSFIETPVGAMAFVVAIIVLLLPLTIVQGYRSHGIGRWWAWTASAMGVVAVLGSIGKAALLVMAISLAYLFTQMGKRRMFVRRGAVAVILFFIMASGGSLAPTLLIERFANITGDVSSKFRIEEARTALQVFIQHPIVGVGAGNLKHYFQRALNGYSGESNVVLAQVAAEFGLVGLMLLVALVLSMRQRIHALNHHVVGHENRLLLLGFKASLIAAAVHGFLEVTFFGLAYGVLFWFLVGMMDGWVSLESPLRRGRGLG